MLTLDRWITILAVSVLVLAFGVTAVSAVTASSPSPDRSIIVGVQGPGSAGQVAVVDEHERITWRRTDAMSYHDVSWRNDSHVLATYALGTDQCRRYDPPCGETGFRVIDRRAGEIVREWSFEVRTVGNSEVHDADVLPSGNVLLADMDRERILIVNDTGDIVWEWHASRVYDPPADPTRTDWLHINDVDRIGAGQYLVSVRNENQLLVVARNKSVLEVVNRDGDRHPFQGQHNPQWLGDGRVLVSDSEGDRVVELAQRNGTWHPVWSVGSAANLRFSWPRDADRLPDGSTLVTDSRNNRVVRVAPNGTTLAVWQTPPLPYEAELVGSGERVGGPHMAGQSHAAQDYEIALLHRAVVGLAHSVGAPAWLQWWHIAAVGLAISIRAVGDWALLAREWWQSEEGATVRCLECGESSVTDSHKGDRVKRCPECDEIKVRRMGSDD